MNETGSKAKFTLSRTFVRRVPLESRHVGPPVIAQVEAFPALQHLHNLNPALVACCCRGYLRSLTCRLKITLGTCSYLAAPQPSDQCPISLRSPTCGSLTVSRQGLTTHVTHQRDTGRPPEVRTIDAITSAIPAAISAAAPTHATVSLDHSKSTTTPAIVATSPRRTDGTIFILCSIRFDPY